jgi:hypothetical protein
LFKEHIMQSSTIQFYRCVANAVTLTGPIPFLKAVFSLICLWAALANAQHSGFDLSAILAPLPSPYLSDWQTQPEIVKVHLTNYAPSKMTYRLWVEIRGARYGFVASGESPRMHLAPLSQAIILGPEMIDWNNIHYNGVLRSQILQTGRIPEDDYELCVTALSEDGRELARFCTPFQTQHSEPITLIVPANGDSIDVHALSFLWTPQLSIHKRPAQYELQIVEVLPGQTRQEAMASNFVHFKSAPLETSFLTLDNITFEEGKNYAWQVRHLYGNGELYISDENASEIWAFVYTSLKDIWGCGCGGRGKHRTVRNSVTRLDEIECLFPEQYDEAGRLIFRRTTTTGQDGRSTITDEWWRYDRGRVVFHRITTTDSDGRVTNVDITMEYDKCGQLTFRRTTTTGPDGRTTNIDETWKHDESCRLVFHRTTSTDANGQTTNKDVIRKYDEKGRSTFTRTTTTKPDGGTTNVDVTWEYDENGRLSKHRTVTTEPDGRTTTEDETWEYDENGRPVRERTTVTGPDGVTTTTEKSLP